MMTSLGATLFLLVGCVHVVDGHLLDIKNYQHQILKTHNQYRREEHAADMTEMVWSRAAAKAAALWADRCQFAHQGKGWGENLAFDANPGVPAVADKIAGSLKAWHDEKASYRYGQYSCGASCHYTQMVWAKTRQVGCALSLCAALRSSFGTFQNAYYLVCFYKEKGNWMGDNPYQAGPPCRQCPAGTRCYNGLCRGATSGKKRPDNRTKPPPARNNKTKPPQGKSNRPKNTNKGQMKSKGNQITKDVSYPIYNYAPLLADGLQTRERSRILDIHNRLRKLRRIPLLTWQRSLEDVARRIIDCQNEYPATASDYVNHDTSQNSYVVKVLRRWMRERADLRGRGCRGLGGATHCNRLTNMLQPSTRGMGCAAKRCPTGRRLTCVYRA